MPLFAGTQWGSVLSTPSSFHPASAQLPLSSQAGASMPAGNYLAPLAEASYEGGYQSGGA